MFLFPLVQEPLKFESSKYFTITYFPENEVWNEKIQPYVNQEPENFTYIWHLAKEFVCTYMCVKVFIGWNLFFQLVIYFVYGSFGFEHSENSLLNFYWYSDDFMLMMATN